jgi:RimJ/RimL family protein N-acetyltransferase
MVANPWPLYDLVIRTERLELRPPREDELLELLALARQGIHDPDEMPFGIAWTDQPSPQFERSFMQYHWGNRAHWTAESWVLDMGVWADGTLVGTQGMNADRFAVLHTVGTGSWLGRAYQGQGIGKQMRSAVLAFAFDHLGAEWATSGAFLDNLTSIGVSRALGYVENGRGRLAPRGVAREMVRLLMTAEQWRSRQRPPVRVEGLAGCRDMFGAPTAVDASTANSDNGSRD